jgi:hypothetical protein
VLFVAIALIAVGILFLFVFPWGGILAAIVGLALLGFTLLGVGRRAAGTDAR